MTNSARFCTWIWVGLCLLVVHAGYVLAADDKEKTQEILRIYNRGNAAAEAGKYKAAVVEFERAAELSRGHFGPNHKLTTALEEELGRTYLALEDYAKAEPLLLRVLANTEQNSGKVSRNAAILQSMVADLYSNKGDLDKAESYFERALKTWQALPRRNEEEFAATLISFANFCALKEDYATAVSLHLRVKKIYEAGNNKDPNALSNLNNLGLRYNKLGEYAKAEAVLRQVVTAREAMANDSAILAGSLYELAYTYKNLGQLDRAETLLQRCLKIQEAKLGPEHRLTLDTLLELGSVYRRTKKYDQAAACYQRGLKAVEAKHGPDSPESFFFVAHMTNLQVDRGQIADALTTSQRSLKMAESRFGEDHTYTATALVNVAIRHQQLNEPAKAEPFFQRALKILEGRLGAEHPDTIQTLESLAFGHASSGRWNDSVAGYDRARRASRRYIARILPALSEAQQLTFLEGDYSGGYQAALSLGLAQSADQTIVRRSAEWLLNGKSVAQQALAERSLLARGSDDPTLAKTVQELNTVRQQLAQLTLAAPKPGAEKTHRQARERLAAQEQELAKRLGQASGRPARDDPWVSLEEVQQALPRDAVLVEFAELRVANFQTRKQAPHFVAWVIPGAGQGEVKIIDLGGSAPIEKAVQAVRDGFRAAQGSAKRKSVIDEKGEADAEKEIRTALAALGQLILAPLSEHLDGTHHWILSPDSELWLVPWGALPLKDGAYAVEKHRISHVISGRDLVTPPFQGKVKRDASVIMADADFDIDPKEAATLTAKLLGKQPPVGDGPRSGPDDPQSKRSAALIGRVGRLPGTAAEASAVKPKLQAYAGEEPWVYRGKNALEGVFKAFHSPKVVVLSTHGFFLEDQEVQAAERPAPGDKEPTLTKDGKLPENPLLRCGLLLAGCNERARASGKQEDGVLTGLEIVGCDLRGTELVVLSACETGLGQVRNGEGVAGLRQAFQLAGAQTVVASLWQVSDRDTALLMSDFFDSLAKGKSKAEALREAQLKRIKAHRDRDGAAHPFFWAAFTLTGK